jgi:hypothetical protein
MNVKKYPIRTNKNIVNIPLYKYHVCNNCVVIIEVDTDEQNFNIFYENCKYENKLSLGNINIYKYETENILNKDEIIVKNEDFTIGINTICKKEFCVNIKGKNTSFTVDDVLSMCKKILCYMYFLEEQTSSKKTYMIKKSCPCVLSTEFQETYVDKMKELNTDIECVICEDECKSCVKLVCGHTYHKECIKEWTKRSKYCPLCRKNYILCEECNNNGYIFFNKTCKVLPKNCRLTPIRPTTDGIFKLSMYDINTIRIRGIKYDRKEKKITFLFN